MTAFILLCRDKRGAADLRARLRPEHLKYIDAHEKRVWLAGPMLCENGAPVGSMLIIEAEDEQAARAFADKDPYAQGGLFESVEVRPYRFVRGRFLAGAA